VAAAFAPATGVLPPHRVHRHVSASHRLPFQLELRKADREHMIKMLLRVETALVHPFPVRRFSDGAGAGLGDFGTVPCLPNRGVIEAIATQAAQFAMDTRAT